MDAKIEHARRATLTARRKTLGAMRAIEAAFNAAEAAFDETGKVDPTPGDPG